MVSFFDKAWMLTGRYDEVDYCRSDLTWDAYLNKDGYFGRF